LATLVGLVPAAYITVRVSFCAGGDDFSAICLLCLFLWIRYFYPIPNFNSVRVSVFLFFELLLVSGSRVLAYRLLQGCQDRDFAPKIALFYYISRFYMLEHMQVSNL